MKLHKTKVDDEIYYYFLKSGAKRFMYRHKYYDSLGKRRERKRKVDLQMMVMPSRLGLKLGLKAEMRAFYVRPQITIFSTIHISGKICYIVLLREK